MIEEGFIAGGLALIDRDTVRWIANQSLFNGRDDREIEPSVKAALVTAVNAYAQKGKLDAEEVTAALEVKTLGDARALIGRLRGIIENPAEPQ